MAIAIVQSTTGNATVPPTTTTAFGVATTTGNAIIVAVADDAADTAIVTGITDNKGNTYVKVASAANSSTGGLWYAKNISGGSGHTISVAWNDATAGRCVCIAQEVSGLDPTAPLDVFTSAVGTSAAPTSGATGTTAQADELVVAMVSRAGTTASTISVGSGYSNFQTVNVANAGLGMQSKVVAATGTQTAGFVFSASRAYVCVIATFKATGGGGGGGGGGGSANRGAGFLTFFG